MTEKQDDIYVEFLEALRTDCGVASIDDVRELAQDFRDEWEDIAGNAGIKSELAEYAWNTLIDEYMLGDATRKFANKIMEKE
jgi:hypothetical protein